MLFGTDGIRGEVVKSPNSDDEAISQLLDQRKISPRLMRIVGEALARTVTSNSQVIIGWDDRPGNPQLVDSLTVGLHLGNCKVTHAGMCATPGLHNAVLDTSSSLGCMITASHNPVSDSGIKVFDSQGFKTYPELELEISELVEQLAAEDRDIDATFLEELKSPDAIFDADSAHKKLLLKRMQELTNTFGSPKPQKLVVDCSKGAATDWVEDLLSEINIEVNEVSKAALEMNHNCGAGELKPTDSWTWQEAKNSPHLLIRSLEESPSGEIIAAALDGDGDRCLFIVATDDGCRVMDGDEMADCILRSANGDWYLAASIESDLSLISSLNRLNANVICSQTAVGDRWLSKELRDKGQNVIGVEDSGHIVLSSPCKDGSRCLVGDGVASMLAVLCANSVNNGITPFEKGYKIRNSIFPSERSKWNGKNELSVLITDLAKQSLGDLTVSGLEGEENLLMLEKEGISIGIRNSGTQAKTNVSLRVSPGIDPRIAITVVEKITDKLSDELLVK